MFETDEVPVRNFTVSVIKDDQYIGACLRRGQEWDGWMRQDLPHLVKPGKDILDIGGNIGWNALMFSDYCPVHTFEPIYYEVAERNAKQNTTRHPVTVHPYGLSNTTTEVEMWIPKRVNGLCNYGGTGIGGSSEHEKTNDKFKLKKLDDVYQGAPCLLKIDVEGHELEVLEGAERTIRTHLPHLYVEIFDMEGPVPKFLKEIGYTTILSRPEHNYLFVSPLSSSS
jgi:FkbM family methyltransferase